MERIITDDGSVTFYNRDADDIYHSRTGAVEEAVRKFAEPSGARQLARQGSVEILDICFGLGYNTAAALDAILQENPCCDYRIIGLEADRRILQMTGSVAPKFAHYALVRQAVAGKNPRIRIIVGDARQSILAVPGMFDIVFLDPFSPAKSPGLWQADFLAKVRGKMKKGAVLATYSCARTVRDNLKKAGFYVSDGPAVGRRSPSTLATNP